MFVESPGQASNTVLAVLWCGPILWTSCLTTKGVEIAAKLLSPVVRSPCTRHPLQPGIGSLFTRCGGGAKPAPPLSCSRTDDDGDQVTPGPAGHQLGGHSAVRPERVQKNRGVKGTTREERDLTLPRPSRSRMRSPSRICRPTSSPPYSMESSGPHYPQPLPFRPPWPYFTPTRMACRILLVATKDPLRKSAWSAAPCFCCSWKEEGLMVHLVASLLFSVSQLPSAILAVLFEFSHIVFFISTVCKWIVPFFILPVHFKQGMFNFQHRQHRHIDIATLV